MAAPNKGLALSNKSRTQGKATKKRERLFGYRRTGEDK
jgi:hypothetical protein